MKTVLIIGMGRFGQHLCRKMLKLNNEVMIVDRNEEAMEDLPVSYTHLDVYKRQGLIWHPEAPAHS